MAAKKEACPLPELPTDFENVLKAGFDVVKYLSSCWDEGRDVSWTDLVKRADAAEAAGRACGFRYPPVEVIRESGEPVRIVLRHRPPLSDIPFADRNPGWVVEKPTASQRLPEHNFLADFCHVWTDLLLMATSDSAEVKVWVNTPRLEQITLFELRRRASTRRSKRGPRSDQPHEDEIATVQAAIQEYARRHNGKRNPPRQDIKDIVKQRRGKSYANGKLTKILQILFRQQDFTGQVKLD
jgi:hypothetical protein